MLCDLYPGYLYIASISFVYSHCIIFEFVYSPRAEDVEVGGRGPLGNLLRSLIVKITGVLGARALICQNLRAPVGKLEGLGFMIPES